MKRSKLFSKVVSKSKKIKKETNRKCICCFKVTPDNFLPIWSELRSGRKLCDGIIKTSDGDVFHIHRIVLSSVSPYFKASFTNRLRRSESEIKELVITNVPSHLVSKIIDYAYTGSCHITEENVYDIIPIADQFHCNGLLNICSTFLLSHLTLENCLGFFKLVQLYFCKDVENQCWCYILHNFKEIYKSSREFFELSPKDLLEILGDDILNVEDETVTFQAIERWIEKDPDARKQYYNKLLECVRFGNMDIAYFNDVIQNHKYNNDETNPILEIAEYVVSKKTKLYEHKMTRPRIPFEVLFAVGGWSDGSTPTNFVETYDSRANQWLQSDYTDTMPLAYHGIVLLNNLIYVIGGFDGTDFLNSMKCFDPVSHTWSDKSCMYYVRGFVSVCTLDGKIYSMGGCNSSSELSSVEMYDPVLNQWALISSMNKARADASAASLNDMIYIVGGCADEEALCSVEVYNPSVQIWWFVTNMTSCRSGVSLVAHGGVLYALGGYDGFLRLHSGEKYDPRTECWEPIANMLYCRSNFASVILDDMVYVMGGFNGTVTISNTERYDANRNEWHEVTGMNLDRSALAACVCKNLPNAKDYSYLCRVANFFRPAGDR